MKMNIDEAIELLQDYIKADREIREGDTESDYSKFCEEKCEAIESLIEYVHSTQNNKPLTNKGIGYIISGLENATKVSEQWNK